MKFTTILLVFSLVFSIFSCRKISDIDRLSSAERMLRTNGKYNSYLALEYTQFARSYFDAQKSKKDKWEQFFNRTDEMAGKHFAKKGVAVMDGLRVIPESPIYWRADKKQIEEMLMQQKRLELVLNEPQIKEVIPIQLAHLTYLYDCWISRESKEVFRDSDLGTCKSRFYKLLDEVENYVEQSKQEDNAEMKINELEFKRFEILFDANSSQYNQQAQHDMIAALNYITSLNEEYKILVVGNGDRLDASIADKNLAFKRAEATKNYLVKNGVSADVVEMRSVGEDFPDVLSKDGEAKQANRKVGIYILKGVKSVDEIAFPVVKNDVYKKQIEEAKKEKGM